MAKLKTFYDGGRWRYHTAPLVKAKNPVCQRLFDDGRQCTHPSTIVHHLIDPKAAPERGHDWKILVAVCDACHAGGQPGELQGRRYCATIGPLETIYHHPGGILPHWHPKYVRPSTGDVSRLAGTSTSTVAVEAIDAALACDMDALLEGL